MSRRRRAPGTAAIYARYSTEQQRRSSLEDQIRACRERASREGISVDEALVFRDAAATGATTQRKGLQRLLRAAEAKRFDVLLVEDVSRISRDTADATELLRRFQRWGVRVIGVADGVDTATDSGVMAFQLRAVLAEQEREAGRQRTRRGLAGRARQGFATGLLPYGYTTVPVADDDGEPTGKKIVIDPAAAKLVRRIFAQYADGHSLQSIAKTLNDEGLPPPRRGRGRTRAWSSTGIREMLHNEAYTGRWTYGRTRRDLDPLTSKRLVRPGDPASVVRREDPSLRIVDEALWTKTRQRLAAIRAGYAGRRGGDAAGGRANAHLVSGLLRCALCARAMTIHTGSSATYYTCPNAWKSGSCANRGHLREDDAIGAVLGLVHQRVQSAPAKAYLAERVAVGLTAASRSEPIEVLEEGLEELERKLGRLVAAIEEGNAAESIRRRISELEAQRATMKATLDQERAKLHEVTDKLVATNIVARTAALRSVLAVDAVRARERLRPLFRSRRLRVRFDGQGGATLDGRLASGTLVRLQISGRN